MVDRYAEHRGFYSVKVTDRWAIGFDLPTGLPNGVGVPSDQRGYVASFSSTLHPAEVRSYSLDEFRKRVRERITEIGFSSADAFDLGAEIALMGARR